MVEMIEMGLLPQDCQEFLQGLQLYFHIKENEPKQFQPHFIPVIVNQSRIDTSSVTSNLLCPVIQDPSALV